MKRAVMAAVGIVVAAGLASPTLAQSSRLVTKDEISRQLEKQRAELARQGTTQGGTTRGITVRRPGDSPSGGTAQPTPMKTEVATRDSATGAVRQVPPPSIPSVAAGAEVFMRITFESGSSVIRPEAGAQLDALCGALQETPESEKFYIIGHADAAGSADYNQLLSLSRAQEVQRYLSSACGIAAARIQPVGAGESELLPEFPAVSVEQRRVEVRLQGAGV